jgi:hypothetical protein
MEFARYKNHFREFLYGFSVKRNKFLEKHPKKGKFYKKSEKIIDRIKNAMI